MSSICQPDHTQQYPWAVPASQTIPGSTREQYLPARPYPVVPVSSICQNHLSFFPEQKNTSVSRYPLQQWCTPAQTSKHRTRHRAEQHRSWGATAHPPIKPPRTITPSKLYLVVPGIVQNGGRVGVTAEEDGHQVWDELLLQCIPCGLHTHTTMQTPAQEKIQPPATVYGTCYQFKQVHVISSNSCLCYIWLRKSPSPPSYNHFVCVPVKNILYCCVFYVYDSVPKGAHARGYALQMKIKHCWKLFLFEMLCCVLAWMNE